MDITASESGFLKYAKDIIDNYKAWTVANYNSFNQLGSITIINIGNIPFINFNQTTFYDKWGNVLLGLNSMFVACSGKLAHG